MFWMVLVSNSFLCLLATSFIPCRAPAPCPESTKALGTNWPIYSECRSVICWQGHLEIVVSLVGKFPSENLKWQNVETWTDPVCMCINIFLVGTKTKPPGFLSSNNTFSEWARIHFRKSGNVQLVNSLHIIWCEISHHLFDSTWTEWWGLYIAILPIPRRHAHPSMIMRSFFHPSGTRRALMIGAQFLGDRNTSSPTWISLNIRANLEDTKKQPFVSRKTWRHVSIHPDYWP